MQRSRYRRCVKMSFLEVVRDTAAQAENLRFQKIRKETVPEVEFSASSARYVNRYTTGRGGVAGQMSRAALSLLRAITSRGSSKDEEYRPRLEG